MDKFKRLKRIVEVDKPVFAKADPNDPIMYKLKQKPGMNTPPPIEEPEVEEEKDLASEGNDFKDIVSKFRKFGEPESAVREDEVEEQDPASADATEGTIDSLLKMDGPDDTLDALEELDPEFYSPDQLKEIKRRVYDRLRSEGKID